MYIGSYVCQLSVKLLWQYLACESCCCMSVKDHLKELDLAACVSRREGLSLCEDDHKATHVIVLQSTIGPQYDYPNPSGQDN